LKTQILIKIHTYKFHSRNRQVIGVQEERKMMGNNFFQVSRTATRVSSETSFVSKEPKLEPKLVSALSETRRLFRLFGFDIETGSFGVSKQPKQTKDQPKKQQIC
jgi:hypothetical protein